jgi:hypothetical protein
MFEQHPLFIAPEPQDAKIWRYIDFTKFMSLFHKQALFFSHLDYMEDKLEGFYPRAYVENLRNLPPVEDPNALLNRDQIIDHNLRFSRYIRDRIYINSWHANEFESAAMWRLYLSNKEGIAIQTTYRRLTQSFHRAIEPIMVGLVNYINFNNLEDFHDNFNFMDMVLNKRKSFEHEKEIRAVFHSVELPTAGHYINVDLDTLIENIYVAPSSQEWFLELVRHTLDLYGIQKEVINSTLDEGPLY